MFRRLHSLAGLVLALGLVVVAVTGAVLSVGPAFDRATQPVVERGISVAALAEAVAARHEVVDRIAVRPTGIVTAAWTDGDSSGVEIVDPATGQGLGPYAVSEFTRFMTNLHRSFFAGENGRIAAAVAALGMLILSVSGLVLTARSLGGWRALARPIRGSGARRWHGELGRLAAAGLILSSATGIWMSADRFGLLPESTAPEITATASGGPAAPIGSLAVLRGVDITDLRELTFPSKEDPADTFALVTAVGETRVDPATGAALAFAPTTTLDRIGATIRMLHTGRGAWALGLLLGLSSAAVPVFAVTGVALWWRRRTALGSGAASKSSPQVALADADTVILVGSEGGSTWGFARTLHSALTETGHRVLTLAMDDLAQVPATADRLLILAATYGDGGAPSSAGAFFARLERFTPRMPVAVLGFGDRTFPQFCRYAQDVAAELDALGFPRLLPMKRVDRQSAQEFAQWGHDLGAALGHDLVLEHVAARPKTATLALTEREDYGEAVGAPVAILRFDAPVDARGRVGRLPSFEAGDLVGIVPPGARMPRFYSLASSTRDGVLEICVRLREGGLCSTFLHGLEPGDHVEAFIRTNPSFRPAEGRSPLILIGAGAGIGPLAGFVRANAAGRPVHLYWGGRSPASDFLYEHELAQHLAEKRLTSLTTAFSREADGAYVQDRIAADAPRLRELIRHGAQVLVCGGRDMADAVRHTLDAVVHPLGLDLATLKSSGRYVEDVY